MIFYLEVEIVNLIEIIASCFLGMRRLDQHRAIHKALGPDVMKKIHALALNVSSD